MSRPGLEEKIAALLGAAKPQLAQAPVVLNLNVIMGGSDARRYRRAPGHEHARPNLGPDFHALVATLRGLDRRQLQLVHQFVDCVRGVH